MGIWYDTSIIVRLAHGPTRALFTGDLNNRLGAYLAEKNFDVVADLLKAPHHGTEGLAPNEFFALVNPKALLVPSPTKLWFSLRSKRTREYFAERKIPTYVGGVHGHVTVVLTAAGFTIQSEHPGPSE
jgi:competence protein ComEC